MHATGSLLAAAAVLAAQAAAQSSSSSGGLGALTGNLTASCQSAAAGLLTTQFASCANVLSLVSVITASGSVIAPLNTWISGICSSAPCSSATLSTAQSSIQSGCSSDISSGSTVAVALNTVITNYPAVRDMLCLQAASNSSFCVTDTLTNVQTARGSDITVSEVETLIGGGTAGLVQELGNVSPSAYCTDCGQAIFTKAEAITTNASSSAGASASSALSSKCGPSFVSGTIPSTVKEAASSSSASSSGSSSASPSGKKSAAAALVPAGAGKGLALVAGAALAGAVAVLA